MVSPSTILNKSISSERSFAGVSIPLSRAKALAKQAGGKLNDVGIGDFERRGQTLSPGARRAAGEIDDGRGTISLREEGNTDANNQVVRHDLLDLQPTSRIPRRGWRRLSRNPPNRRRCRIRCGP